MSDDSATNHDDDGSTAKAEETTTEAEPKKSRAGRDLPAALGVGFSLGIGIILILLFAPKLWYVVVAVAFAIATWEVAKRLRDGGYDVALPPLLVGGQAIIWSSWPWGTTGVLVAFVATLLVLMVWMLLAQGINHALVNYLKNLSASVFVLAWLPLLAWAPRYDRNALSADLLAAMVGTGISAMHYLGMSAVLFPGTFRFSSVLIVATSQPTTFEVAAIEND